METNRPVFVLDPGHGGQNAALGSSPNHSSAANGLLEKDLTLDIAGRVERLLSPVADVRLTRSSDMNLALSARARIARDSNAAVFLSLHLNGSSNPDADGTEAWVARTANRGSVTLAENVAARVAAVAGAPNRGVKHRDLGVLLPDRHSANTAACLVELAFLTNPQQARNLSGSAYRDRVAAAIADAIRETLSARTTSTAADWAVALGKQKDKPADFPKSLRSYWAASHERLFHAYWHQARRYWPSLSTSERNDILTFGFSAPPRLTTDAGAGLDFLFMHREMVRGTRDFAVANKLSYRPQGWDPIPWDHKDTNWPMPVISTEEEYKKQDITDYWRKMVRKQYGKKRWLEKIELDDLGKEIEDGIHGWFHMHWSTDEPADLTITAVTNDWLGDPFSAAVNPAFWKLHGWIDELIDRWDKAQKDGKTGRSVTAALKGFTPWVGPALTPAVTHSLAMTAPMHHGTNISEDEIRTRIARFNFKKWDPFPFAKLTLDGLRQRFGREDEEDHPVLVAGLDCDDASAYAMAIAEAATCGNDEAVTENLALLVSDEAPLPVGTFTQPSAAGELDYKSVCAVVPDSPDEGLLIFFHGNNHYVTVASSGDVKADQSGHSRVPRWANKRATGGAQSKSASAIQEKLDQLEVLQAAVKLPADAIDPGVKKPVVLVPEDGQLVETCPPPPKTCFWSVPPVGQYLSDSKKLERLVLDCYEHLRCLTTPTGRTYLGPRMEDRSSWVSNVRRVYLAGHSGGGKPLAEAAGSDMMLVTPTSAMGVDGRAADLWLLDCTYGFPHNDLYAEFCKNWKAAGRLDYAASCTRFVCVYRAKNPDSDTESGANKIRTDIAKELGVKADTLLRLHDSADMNSKSMRTVVLPALLSMPVVFIRTKVEHGDIPSKFIPLLLRTAAS